MSDHVAPAPPTLADLARCFEGAVPAVIATAGADGTPNVTYLSRIRLVDGERVALSNQFLSKTAKNLAENPRASVLLLDPLTYDEYRLQLAFERTDRRGPVFERLRADVDVTAALQGMQDVFRLRAADVYRVTSIDRVLGDAHRRGIPPPAIPEGRHDGMDASRIAELSARLGRCGDVATVVGVALEGLDELFGYGNSVLWLHDPVEEVLFTIASHGYPDEGVGSETPVGDGVVGMVATRCAPIRIGNTRQIEKYARTVRRSFEALDERAGRDVPAPGLVGARSQVAVPAMAMGSLVGVLLVESADAVAFGEADESVLTVVASVIASVIDAERSRERQGAGDVVTGTPSPSPTNVDTASTHVRFFEADGSVFVDGDYLIKGVAGRILASLLRQFLAEGRTDFTNREVRLDPSLELPSFRDNFDSRLILLKRRLDERVSTLRIDKTGRGRFRLVVGGEVDLDVVAPG